MLLKTALAWLNVFTKPHSFDVLRLNEAGKLATGLSSFAKHFLRVHSPKVWGSAVALFDWALKHTQCFCATVKQVNAAFSGQDLENEIPTFIRICAIKQQYHKSRCESHVHQMINYIECGDSNEIFELQISDFIETRRVLSPKTVQSRNWRSNGGLMKVDGCTHFSV